MAWYRRDRATHRCPMRSRMLFPAILLGLIASFVLTLPRPVAAAPPANDDFASAAAMPGDTGTLSATNDFSSLITRSIAFWR